MSLQANASDPDADNLVMTYSAPLNENGEWQTNYGDAGEYKVTITVSDGITADSREALIIVSKKEEKPEIGSAAPAESNLAVKEGD